LIGDDEAVVARIEGDALEGESVNFANHHPRRLRGGGRDRRGFPKRSGLN
jgi:hypothetical protein